MMDMIVFCSDCRYRYTLFWFLFLFWLDGYLLMVIVYGLLPLGISCVLFHQLPLYTFFESTRDLILMFFSALVALAFAVHLVVESKLRVPIHPRQILAAKIPPHSQFRQPPPPHLSHHLPLPFAIPR